MKAAVWRRHRLLNGLQSLLLLGAMAAILSGLGWVVAGESGVFWALAGGVALVLFNPGFSPRLVLRMYAARALGPREAPALHGLLATLAERAGLPTAPELYYVPSRMLNAFAVGTRSHSAVAATDALLRTHPATKERIQRLLALESGMTPRERPRTVAALPRVGYPAVDRRPRWHVNGMWY